MPAHRMNLRMYMNASRLRRFFVCYDCDRMGCKSIFVHGLPPMSKIGLHFEGHDCVRTFGF